LAEEAQKRFDRPFSRNSLRGYALKNGYYHALPEEKGERCIPGLRRQIIKTGIWWEEMNW
jgi:hypothetical protein